MNMHFSPESAPEAGDRAENLVDQFKLDNLEKIEAAGLTSYSLPAAPWSDSYWPIYAGVLAQRYADPGYTHSTNWKKNNDYFFANINSTSIDTLSPAEKYELIIGDQDHTLSKMMLNEGKGYYERYGEVETWMGICHGWAPASFMLARPSSKIMVTAYDGHTQVPLYPSDIKGLATALWAYGRAEERFIGSRCDVKNPETNSKGRIIEPGCFDTNPATWHLTVVNQLGVSKRSFVLDATYDHQVWNQPARAYKFTYFNPQTGVPVRTLAEATVSKREYTKDKFREFRSTLTSAFVGIAMDLTYVSETSPSHAERDSEDDDNFATVRYLYDLELDKTGKIIGGEWYMNQHPDFLWVPVLGEQASTYGDILLDRSGSNTHWDGKHSIPPEWRGPGTSSAKYGQPLRRVVSTLITLSRLGI